MSVNAATTVSIVPWAISRSSSASVSIPRTVPGPPGRGAPCVPSLSSTAMAAFIPGAHAREQPSARIAP
jgi:hypothetical protein